MQLKRSKDCGCDAHDRNRIRNVVSSDAAGQRGLNDQGYVQRRMIDEEAVFFFAMLAERLAVIAGQYDQRSIIGPSLFEKCDHPS